MIRIRIAFAISLIIAGIVLFSRYTTPAMILAVMGATLLLPPRKRSGADSE